MLNLTEVTLKNKIASNAKEVFKEFILEGRKSQDINRYLSKIVKYSLAENRDLRYTLTFNNEKMFVGIDTVEGVTRVAGISLELSLNHEKEYMIHFVDSVTSETSGSGIKSSLPLDIEDNIDLFISNITRLLGKQDKQNYIAQVTNNILSVKLEDGSIKKEYSFDGAENYSLSLITLNRICKYIYS